MTMADRLTLDSFQKLIIWEKAGTDIIWYSSGCLQTLYGTEDGLAILILLPALEFHMCTATAGFVLETEPRAPRMLGKHYHIRYFLSPSQFEFLAQPNSTFSLRRHLLTVVLRHN